MGKISLISMLATLLCLGLCVIKMVKSYHQEREELSGRKPLPIPKWISWDIPWVILFAVFLSHVFLTKVKFPQHRIKKMQHVPIICYPITQSNTIMDSITSHFFFLHSDDLINQIAESVWHCVRHHS